MRRIPQGLAGLALACMLCAPGRAQAPSLTDRPSDDLLNRPDLQAVVDLQTARDGALLIELLGHEDAAMRARAAFALASVQDADALSSLLDLLHDPVAAVRADAAFALGQLPGPVPVAALLDALNRASDTAEKHRLIEALSKKGDAASIASLVALDPGEASARSVALALSRYALRQVYHPAALPVLVAYLQAEEADTREYAAYFFSRADTTAWATAADTLRSVLDHLATDDPAAMHLVRAIGTLNDPQDTPRLLHWMSAAEDWRTAVNAVRVLRERTDIRGVRAALYEQLVHASEHVAVAAAEALNDGKAWSEKDVSIIKDWFQYNAYAWRITSPLLEALARQGEYAFVWNELDRRRGAPPLIAYATGLHALAQMPRDEVFNELVNAARHPNTQVSYEALRTLGKRWEHDRKNAEMHALYFDTFASGLRRRDAALISASAPVLADEHFSRFGALGLLMTTYTELEAPQDTEAMLSILQALGTAADTTAAPLLHAAAENLNPLIAEAARTALTRVTGEQLTPPDTTQALEQPIDWVYLQELGRRPRLVLHTEKGDITLELDAEQAPLTVQTLAQLAESGALSDVPFHRVVANFVIQGGDVARGDGFGSGSPPIRSEFSRIDFTTGVVGMASSGKDTEASQFFIVHSMQPHLDGVYTAFGAVLEGQETVDRLYAFDRIRSATLLRDAL